MKDKYTKMAVKTLFWHGLRDGAIGFIIGVGLFSFAFDLKRLGLFTLAFGLSFLFQYFLYYRPNMPVHEKLVLKGGEAYIQALESQLAKEGMYALLAKNWFQKNADRFTMDSTLNCDSEDSK